MLNDLHAFSGFWREEIVLPKFVIVRNIYSALRKLFENEVISGTYGEVVLLSHSFVKRCLKRRYNFTNLCSCRTYIVSFKQTFEKPSDRRDLEIMLLSFLIVKMLSDQKFLKIINLNCYLHFLYLVGRMLQWQSL